MKKKLLVTGISGFLGQHLAQFPQHDWQIIGTHFSNPVGVPKGISSLNPDLTNKEEVQALINQTTPDAILHLAANSSTGACEKKPALSYPINVTASQHLAKISEQKSIQFLYTSSEQVYDGVQNSYTETDLPKPINAYGKQKAAAEKIVAASCPNACIIRLSVLFGFHRNGAYCFMNDWLDKWKNGQAVTVFKDEYRSFLSATSAAEGLFLLLNNKAKGIYHLGGKNAYSRYDFAVEMKEIFGIKNGEILPSWQKDFTGMAARPARLILKMDKMAELGFEQKNVKEALMSLARK